EPLLSTTHPLSEPWPQWQQPRQNCSSSAGTSSACCCRCSWNAAFTGCSGTPCRSWRTRCPGPGGRCWGSAGSEPPTEAPAPSPGRPCHQVLLCFSTSMGASAAQEWGVPCVPSSEEHLPRSVRGR
ncbi:neuronatin, isoform CRA_g, partial [Mus musculus]